MKTWNNCCAISDIKKLKTTEETNQYIDAISKELGLSKVTVASTLQFFQKFSGDKYIDIGCVALALMTMPHKGIYINLTDGRLAVGDRADKPKLNEVRDKANNLKQVIAQIFVDEGASHS